MLKCEGCNSFLIDYVTVQNHGFEVISTLLWYFLLCIHCCVVVFHAVALIFKKHAVKFFSCRKINEIYVHAIASQYHIGKSC